MHQDLQPFAPIRVIPVLDLMAGKAVHARAGDRRTYPALSSRLVPGSDPIELASAYRDALGLTTLYLADLDAIEHDRPDINTLARLGKLGLELWADAGARDVARLEMLVTAGVSSLILATESLPNPGLLSEAIRRFGAARVIFGLDLKDGQPMLAEGSRWVKRGALDLVETALSAGARRVLLLDVARVGSSRGVGTLALLETLRRRFGRIDVAVGGGVASLPDITAAADAGASAVLVGSALHDGRITGEDLR
jgi:phosphoribosylformimino-5-aminoimidazole carboxamide ribotide isomerase